MSEVKTTPKTQVPPKAAPVETKAEAKLVTAVFGRMVHPYTHQVFDQGKETKVWNVDSWLEVQIEAGKLTYVAA